MGIDQPVLSIIVSPDRRFLHVGCGDGGLVVTGEWWLCDHHGHGLERESGHDEVGGGLRRRGVLSSITQTKEKRMKTQTWESRTGLDPSYNKIVVPGSDVRGTLSFVVRFGSEG